MESDNVISAFDLQPSKSPPHPSHPCVEGMGLPQRARCRAQGSPLPGFQGAAGRHFLQREHTALRLASHVKAGSRRRRHTLQRS